jgi:hypothetical protein
MPVYSRATEAEARQAKILTQDGARRIAINMARLVPGSPSLRIAEIASHLCIPITTIRNNLNRMLKCYLHRHHWLQ